MRSAKTMKTTSTCLSYLPPWGDNFARKRWQKMTKDGNQTRHNCGSQSRPWRESLLRLSFRGVSCRVITIPALSGKLTCSGLWIYPQGTPDRRWEIEMRRLYLAIIRMMLLEGYACAMIDKMLNMSKRKRQEDGEAMQPRLSVVSHQQEARVNNNCHWQG